VPAPLTPAAPAPPPPPPPPPPLSESPERDGSALSVAAVAAVPAWATPPVPTRPSRRPEARNPTIDLRDQLLGSIGIVTPFAAQRDALRDLLLERFGRSITVDTPDSFQGDERDIIIVSLVIGELTRRELIDLVADDARLNVTMTRARSRLIIVGDRDAAKASGTRLADLVTWIDGRTKRGPTPAY
jgi:hypothetical protein